MKILHLNWLAATILIGLITINVLNAQPPRKAMERLEQFKKMKLIEMLDMDEETSEKFFVKYNQIDDKHKEKRQELEKTLENLKTAIKYDSSVDELQKLTEKVIKLQKEMHEIHLEKLKAMKSILDKKQYAKYVLFENIFADEVRKRIHKMYQRHRGGRNRNGGGPMNNDMTPGPRLD